jgi:hypothetical protein
LAFLQNDQLNKILRIIENQPCIGENENNKNHIAMYKALIDRDYKNLEALSASTLMEMKISSESADQLMFLVSINMLSKYVMGDIQVSKQIFEFLQ